MMDTVFLEFPHEVEVFLAYCRQNNFLPSKFRIIALWPNVQVLLVKRGIPYSNTLPYFSNQSHERILLTSEKWLQTVEKVLILQDKSGLTRSYCFLFTSYLRFYINYFLWALEILMGVSSQAVVGRVIVCAGRKKGNCGPKLEFEDQYFSDIAVRYCRINGIKVEVLRDCKPDPRPFPKIFPWGFFRNLVWQMLARYHWLRLRSFSTKPTIMVTSLSYNMDSLIRRLRKQFPFVRWVLLEMGTFSMSRWVSHIIKYVMKHGSVDLVLPIQIVSHQVQNEEKDLQSMYSCLEQVKGYLQGEGLKEFRFEGVSFVEVFRDKIEQDLFSYLYSQVQKATFMRHLFVHELHPRLILSPFAGGTEAILGELSKQCGISSLSIPHGTFVPPHTRPDEIEEYRLGLSLILTTFEYTALQSPWAERYFNYFREKSNSTPIKTGNLIFSRVDSQLRDTMRKKILGAKHQNEKLITYATTLKARPNLRFQIHETLDEHLVGVADLVDVIRQIPKTTLMIKLHPAAALKDEEVRQLVPYSSNRQVRIATQIPFRDVLSASDILISYSSTCIEEAIQSRVPVILYDRWHRYQHLPASQIDQPGGLRLSPVYYVKNVQELPYVIRWVIEHHDSAQIEGDYHQHIYPESIYSEFLEFISYRLGRTQNEEWDHSRYAKESLSSDLN